MAGQKLLYETYSRMERRIAPGLRYSQDEYEAQLYRYIGPDTSWLDLGCGRRVLPAWRADSERQLVARAQHVFGIDLDLDSLRDNESVGHRCQSSVAALPFADQSFTLVTANMVMEHVDDPAAMLVELRRVLKPGGHLIFHTPNASAFPTVVTRLLPDAVKQRAAYLLDGRESKDVFPTYYRANSAGIIRALAANAGFDVAELNLVSSTAVFALVPPLAAMELFWIRSLTSPRRAEKRSNIIAVLRRQA
jgi:ubiquinone/menaquinone biosynthesis C-methylase UbiE